MQKVSKVTVSGRLRLLIGISVLACSAAGCAATTPLPTAAVTPTVTRTVPPIPPTAALAAAVEPSLTPTFLATQTPIPTLPICAPLAGYAFDVLPTLVSNPFHPPAAGSDEPHQGVDLAVVMAGSEVATAGHGVQAVMGGTVALVLNDRFPYGNAVMIETRLEDAVGLPWNEETLPTPAPTLEARSALTCPALSDTVRWDAAHRSLYVLYAHLQTIQPLAVGQMVSCGEALGLVGSSGNALNPHLHVEMRVGPAAAQLGSMAHYDVSAASDEMAAYCLLRVSGLFQLVDPFLIMR